ncbi:pirin family protein [Sulfurimonas marina]|uniref:Pirin family protein n=1 Tax=Sulfurimonas marina TaxID=2590551 RepID=A0A7M1ATQ2_9BACT|nr:pirin family protein [Sulfurimonas marina]QOP40770.1 pirin family protein [Sulfurimonas marina]
MLNKIAKEELFFSDKGWLQSRFHFSFAEYINHENRNFGVLRVLNDDVIKPQSGFDMHPHRDMEIVTYVTEGEITHKDSMGNEETLKAGEVQYMSAGSGIFHAEYNNHPSKELKLLQIWILPPKHNLPILYGSHKFSKEERENKLLRIVSSQNSDAKIKLHQDVNMYVSELGEGKTLSFELQKDRQVYFVVIKGELTLNGLELNAHDACECTDETSLEIKALSDTHFLFIEMAKG